MLLHIFNNKIICLTCKDQSLYNSEELKRTITKIFSMPHLNDRNKNGYWNSVVGTGLITDQDDYLSPAILPDCVKLSNWIETQVNLYAKEFNINEKLILDKNWMDRLYRGSELRCHKHMSDLNDRGKNAELVAVFYFNNPPGGARLGICNKGHDPGQRGLSPSEMPSSNIEYIDCPTGTLIIHHGNCWHAVEAHNLDTPRTIFVYHFVLKS